VTKRQFVSFGFQNPELGVPRIDPPGESFEASDQIRSVSTV